MRNFFVHSEVYILALLLKKCLSILADMTPAQLIIITYFRGVHKGVFFRSISQIMAPLFGWIYGQKTQKWKKSFFHLVLPRGKTHPIFLSLLHVMSNNPKPSKKVSILQTLVLRGRSCTYLSCSGLPPDVAFVIAQAASFLILKSEVVKSRMIWGKIFDSIACWICTLYK